MTVVAKTQLAPSTIQEVEQSIVNELMSTFDRAEQAMHAHDLDTILTLYSDEYRYHGLDKSDIRNVWRQLFEHYRELESKHTFSMIRRVGPVDRLTVEITCTGVVWGTSKQTTLRTPVDSWYEEVHYLRNENGQWRIVGHAGGNNRLIPQFGIAPHPLF